MNTETRRKLQQIGARIPKRLTDNLITKQVDTSEEELAHAALKSKDISPQKKALLRKSLERGDFRRSEEVLNEKTIKEIDDFNAREVKRLRDAGELPDPNEDPFVKERNWKAANRGSKKAEYSTFLKASEASRHLCPLGDKVVLQEVVKEEKQALIIVPNPKEKQQARYGKIFRVGPKCVDVKEGQDVLFNLYGFEYLETHGERFLVGPEKEIMGIVI